MAVLTVIDVNVHFDQHHAVRDVSLEVDEASIVGLIGPNGAGKTTTFNAITGVQRCTGRVSLDGRDISGAPPHKRSRLGMNRTFQRLEVFGSMTAFDNIRTAAEITALTKRRSIRGAVEETERLIDLLGLGSVADHPADVLSTGQARLVEIARAVATGPKVLLLDEPASGLDDTETRRLATVLHRLRDDGMAILMVEHDIDLVMDLCTTINVLDLGVLIASGSPAEVRNDQAVRDAYLGAA